MIKLSLKEAEGRLGHLIEEAAAGQEVVITTRSGAKVRLVPLPKEEEDAVPPANTQPPKMVGHALDRFIGTWSAEQEAEVLKAVEFFERVNESFWQ
jgi:prevent-host-death family protein